MLDRTVRILALLAGAWTGLAPLAAPAAAQTGPLDRLSVHGFLTQTYGASDGHQLLGIPSYGTADYRTAALQFRYDATDRDAFVVQFSHERLGRSPLARHEPDLDLDWVFYERRFGDATVARVGKIQSPLGIYNQIRDVGTLLPLYRPPTALYSEQMYTTETVDGLMVGRRMRLGDWGMSLEGFFGNWEYLQHDMETFTEVDKGLGAQLWLETPLQGLRVGGAAVRYDARNVVEERPELADDEFLWLASLDGTFSRFFVRAETYRVDFGEAAAGYRGHSAGRYGQVGLHVTEVVSVVAQAEWVDFQLNVQGGPMPLSFHGTLDRDFALGFRYQPSPHLALKLEGHGYRGYGVEDQPPSIFFGDPVSATYGLFSVSTSF